ncbi:hypothetical protein FQN57_002356 [Myotisia sp. PD_48]|nr:hypothetical protein FQN57_002356 [Myotisia sp. PD_48]
MSYPNCLDTASWEGEVDGITIKWHLNAQERLDGEAIQYDMDLALLKKMHEHFVYESTKRLEAKTAYIIGPAPPTCTRGDIKFLPLGLVIARIRDRPAPNPVTVYIYLDGLDPRNVDRDLEKVAVKGESVAVKGESVAHQPKIMPELSIGEYPPHLW